MCIIQKKIVHITLRLFFLQNARGRLIVSLWNAPQVYFLVLVTTEEMFFACGMYNTKYEIFNGTNF